MLNPQIGRWCGWSCCLPLIQTRRRRGRRVGDRETAPLPAAARFTRTAIPMRYDRLPVEEIAYQRPACGCTDADRFGPRPPSPWVSGRRLFRRAARQILPRALKPDTVLGWGGQFARRQGRSGRSLPGQGYSTRCRVLKLSEGQTLKEHLAGVVTFDRSGEPSLSSPSGWWCPQRRAVRIRVN